MALLGGWLCEVTYINPLLPPSFEKLPIKGAGAWSLVPLAMPVTVVQPGFVNGGPKRGSEAAERGEGVGGVSPSHGREICQNLCLKTAFSCTLDTIIRGSLCRGIDQFLLLFFFHSFPNEFVPGKHFPFPFLSSFVLLADQWGGGGGGIAPLCILAIPVTMVQPRFVNGGRARGGCGRGVSHGREIFQNCV